MRAVGVECFNKTATLECPRLQSAKAGTFLHLLLIGCANVIFREALSLIQ